MRAHIVEVLVPARLLEINECAAGHRPVKFTCVIRVYEHGTATGVGFW